MGSPIVFQTAPPQPASKARMTWPPVLVGGPDASQNGFGLVMPKNVTLRSAIVILQPHPALWTSTVLVAPKRDSSTPCPDPKIARKRSPGKNKASGPSAQNDDPKMRGTKHGCAGTADSSHRPKRSRVRDDSATAQRG